MHTVYRLESHETQRDRLPNSDVLFRQLDYLCYLRLLGFLHVFKTNRWPVNEDLYDEWPFGCFVTVYPQSLYSDCLVELGPRLMTIFMHIKEQD